MNFPGCTHQPTKKKKQKTLNLFHIMFEFYVIISGILGSTKSVVAIETNLDAFVLT